MVPQLLSQEFDVGLAGADRGDHRLGNAGQLEGLPLPAVAVDRGHRLVAPSPKAALQLALGEPVEDPDVVVEDAEVDRAPPAVLAHGEVEDPHVHVELGVADRLTSHRAGGRMGVEEDDRTGHHRLPAPGTPPRQRQQLGEALHRHPGRLLDVVDEELCPALVARRPGGGELRGDALGHREDQVVVGDAVPRLAGRRVAPRTRRHQLLPGGGAAPGTEGADLVQADVAASRQPELGQDGRVADRLGAPLRHLLLRAQLACRETLVVGLPLADGLLVVLVVGGLGADHDLLAADHDRPSPYAVVAVIATLVPRRAKGPHREMTDAAVLQSRAYCERTRCQTRQSDWEKKKANESSVSGSANERCAGARSPSWAG